VTFASSRLGFNAVTFASSRLGFNAVTFASSRLGFNAVTFASSRLGLSRTDPNRLRSGGRSNRFSEGRASVARRVVDGVAALRRDAATKASAVATGERWSERPI